MVCHECRIAGLHSVFVAAVDRFGVGFKFGGETVGAPSGELHFHGCVQFVGRVLGVRTGRLLFAKLEQRVAD